MTTTLRISQEDFRYWRIDALETFTHPTYPKVMELATRGVTNETIAHALGMQPTQVKCALRWHSRHGLGLAKTIGVSNLTRTGLATIYRYAHLTDQLRAPSKTWMADAAGLAKRSSAMWLTLQQLPTGSTNKEIGEKLSISELTVKSHLTRARSVLAPFAGEAGILCLSRTGLAGIALLARQTATARIY